jgi:hypothetical protein
MGSDIHASGENRSIAFEDYDGDVRSRFKVRERLREFARHREVDDIERWID